MADYKLYVKNGDFEFSAEGPEAMVLRDLEMWKALAFDPQNKPTERSEGAYQGRTMENETDPSDLSRIFVSDEKKGTVSLKLFPRSEDKNPASLLLLLLGFRQLLQKDEVMVTELKAALKQSGCVIDRIDDIAGKSLSSGLINKGGRGKGGRYSLTNAGVRAAQELIFATLQQ